MEVDLSDADSVCDLIHTGYILDTTFQYRHHQRGEYTVIVASVKPTQSSDALGVYDFSGFPSAVPF